MLLNGPWVNPRHGCGPWAKVTALARRGTKYKEVMEFLKKLLLCDKEVTQTDDIITYGFLVQGILQEYSSIVNSKRWEPTDIKKIFKDKSLLLTASTVAIESPLNKTVKKGYCKLAATGKTINMD